MNEVLDEGPFFHGTVANLNVGDLLTSGYRSNYRPEVVMNHIYFTAITDGAGLAAENRSGTRREQCSSGGLYRGTDWAIRKRSERDRQKNFRAILPGRIAAMHRPEGHVKAFAPFMLAS